MCKLNSQEEFLVSSQSGWVVTKKIIQKKDVEGQESKNAKKTHSVSVIKTYDQWSLTSKAKEYSICSVSVVKELLNP